MTVETKIAEAKQAPTIGIAKFERGATVDLGGNYEKIGFEVWLGIPAGAAENSSSLRDYLKTGQELLDGVVADWEKNQKIKMLTPVKQSSPLQPQRAESTKPWKKWKDGKGPGESLGEEDDPDFALFLGKNNYDGKEGGRFKGEDGFDYWLPPLAEGYSRRRIQRIRSDRL